MRIASLSPEEFGRCTSGSSEACCVFTLAALPSVHAGWPRLPRESRPESGIATSQSPVTAVTARAFMHLQNADQERTMPILMVALIALAAFGLIGLLLVLAVSLEQKKKINTPESHPGKVA
jgi:hypothetical protein